MFRGQYPVNLLRAEDVPLSGFAGLAHFAPELQASSVRVRFSMGPGVLVPVWFAQAALGATTIHQGPFPVPFNTENPSNILTLPTQSLAKIKAPPGFKVSVFAAEPDVQNPIAITTDDRGRLWVAENYTYAENGFEMSLRDRIIVLEDNHHTGHFDKRTVFWDGAQKLTSIEVGFGGVWALCAPRLLFIPDRDGDLVPDGEPEVVLDGWDDRDVHHNIVNGLRWGPDGWLYGRHGIQGTSHVGKPGAAAGERQQLNCCIWRYHPTRRVFEIVCQGTTNPWGMDWNDVGDAFFINTVIGHLWQVIPGAHYKRMYGEDFDPHVYELIDQHADHYHWDTGKTWNTSHGNEGKAGELGGGHAHEGLMIYLGDNWPEVYRNGVFMVNLHGLRINHDLLIRSGSGYVGRHTNDFLYFNDPWFRGIELLYGPDGGVFVADWCDIGECHEQDGVHRTSGRIYKVTYGTIESPLFDDLSQLTDTELVRLQLEKNDWYVRKARRLLQERAAAGRDLSAAHASLLKLFENQADTTRKLRALWSLATSGGANHDWLLKQLRHQNQYIRVWAIRFLTDGDITNDAFREFVRMGRKDESAIVRLALASALQCLPPRERIELGTALLAHAEDAADHNLPLMLWYGIEPIAHDDPAALAGLLQKSRIPLIRKFIARRLTEEIERNPALPNALLEWAAEHGTTAEQIEVLEGMGLALRGWRKAPKPSSWDRVTSTFLQSHNPAVRERASELGAVFGDGRALTELRNVAMSDSADPSARRVALQTLIESRAPDLLPVILGLLSNRILARTAVQGLAIFNDPGLAHELVARYREFRGDVRPDVISTLASRVSFARVLLEAVAAGTIPRQDISAFHARQIHSLGDAELDQLLTRVWGEFRSSSQEKQQQMEALRARFSPERLKTADVKHGQQVFVKTCGVCHRLYGEGASIGPDLTGSGRKDLGYLLENILDPSAVVAADYKMSIIDLKDGRVLTGIVGEKRERTISVQTLNEKLTLERSEIEKIQSSSVSLMPEGLLDTLIDDEKRDLIGYLMTPSQP
jgi:putative membrane-bound dehydrogenase-like protein